MTVFNFPRLCLGTRATYETAVLVRRH